MGEADEVWSSCTQALRANVNESTWQSCFNSTTAVSLDDRSLLVAAPSSLVKSRLDSQYAPMITAILVDLGIGDVDFLVTVRPDHTPAELFPETGVGEAGRLVDASPAPAAPSTGTGRIPPPPQGSNRTDPGAPSPRYTFESFVTGASNRFAHAAALSVAETPARSYNPLFIYGVAGLGKTHLLHAISHYVRENYAAYSVRYVSTEAYLNDFVNAIRTNATTHFKRKYREVDVLLVDDIQFMEGKEGLQEEFFHNFNELHGANKQIVMSSDRPPKAIATLHDRLKSRFEWGLITDVQPPDFETRLAILRMKADRDPTDIPSEVLELIASRVTNNIRELEGALTRVSAYASLNQVPLTLEAATRELSDVLTDSAPRAITAQVILEATSAMFGFSVEDLQGKSRRRPLVTARQVGMYVCRELTDLSYPSIAREYGGRDHTTVIHAYDKIRSQMGERRQIYDQVTELMQAIKTGG